MPKKDNKNKQPSLPRQIINKLWSLRKQMNDVYKDTYSTDPTNREELDRIGLDIEDNVSKILTRNKTGDIANISNLYAIANLRNAIDSGDYNKSIIDYFEDRSITDKLLNSYTENKWIEELDQEYDIVCKFMPKLVEAMNSVKDAVLTADNFDKEFLSFTSPNKSPDESSAFSEEMENIKKQYNLYERVDTWYDNTSKYGEQFVYKAPYKKALAKLMNRKNETTYRGLHSFIGTRESYMLLNEGAIPREFKQNSDLLTEYNASQSFIKEHGLGSIKLEVVKDGILETAVTESSKVMELKLVAEQTSLNESKLSDPILPTDQFEMPLKMKDNKNDNVGSQEGIVGKDRDTIVPDNLKVPGILLKDLIRKNIILLYIDEICLGYYYIEFLDRHGGSVYSDNIFNRRSVGSLGYSTGAKLQDKESTESAVDELLKYLSSAIVANLDDKFINNNAFLRKEIYSILKYNDMYNCGRLDTVRITYLAPGDVEHIFFKQDPETHRGISDLLPGLIPAKMWCCLWIANTIGILTRGQDKRVYYVKQNVEQNIAQTMLNVINQIKKQNFNIMQIENMNSILNITGKYNDYIVPVGPSGDPPVNMEVMEGQNIDPQTELMDRLEESAINPIIPIEFITARTQLDFAAQYTMTSVKIIRFVFKRQTKVEFHLENIATDIYNAEYENNDGSNRTIVKCILPSPIMLNINNFNQLMDLVRSQAENAANFEYFDDNEEDVQIKRMIFIKNYIHSKLGTYIKGNELEMIKNKSDIEYEIYKKNNNDDEE